MSREFTLQLISCKKKWQHYNNIPHGIFMLLLRGKFMAKFDWDLLLDKIKESIGKGAFDTWFQTVNLKEWNEQQLLIEVPDSFFKDWIENRYFDTISMILAEMGFNNRPEFIINDSLIKKKTHNIFSKIKETFTEEPINSIKLNSRFTFDDFVIGPSNDFAYSSSAAIANSPGKIYNPFFIYGKVGLGKTHLMQAIAHKILQDEPATKICYISSERFMNELITSIQTKTTEKFRLQYRNVDVLIIDDIHFLAGKEATQQEFFHTFNVLYDNHKQIIMSSDRPPKEIANLEERLVSRFSWGLVVDIKLPDFETRVAILKKKIEKEPVQIPDDVICFIAESIKTNIRELEGALGRILAYSLMNNLKIDINMSKYILKDMISEAPAKIDIDIILEKVADFYKITKQDIKSRKRTKNIVNAKQTAIYLARELTDYSFPEIGSFFGGKHHTTIMHSHKTVGDKIKEDKDMLYTINNIKQSLLL